MWGALIEAIFALFGALKPRKQERPEFSYIVDGFKELAEWREKVLKEVQEHHTQCERDLAELKRRYEDDHEAMLELKRRVKSLEDEE